MNIDHLYCDRCGLRLPLNANLSCCPDCIEKYSAVEDGVVAWEDDQGSSVVDEAVFRHFALLIQSGNGLAMKRLREFVMDSVTPEFAGMLVDRPEDIPGYADWLEAYERKSMEEIAMEQADAIIDGQQEEPRHGD